MPSQFFGLNISYTGLLASNAGLNTTANNIANVQTKGYSRQTVSQSASDALRTFTTYGCAGAGVDVLAIERIRDEFYDVKYWNNNASYGEYDVKAYYMSQFERYFADTEDIEGFTTIFNKMYDAMAEVKKKAGTIESKTEFVGFAKSLTEYFNDMAANLEKMQKDVNDEIKNKVDNINSLATQISSLNQQINVIEMNGKGVVANELRDQRTVLIDSLSKIVDVEVKETPIYDANNPDRFTGAYNFQVKICGGQTLVDSSNYNTLQCVAREKGNKMNQSDVDGLYDIAWTSGLEVNLYGKNLGGELKALIEMRDGNNGENFRGTVSAVNKGGAQVNGVAHDTVTIDVTEDYLMDLSKCTLSDTGGEISLGNQIFKYDSWSATKNANGTMSYTFVLSKDNENKVSGNRIGKEAEVGTSVNYQGIPYYQEQMNEFVRIYAQKFNEILTQENAVDSYGDPAVYLFVGDKEADPSQFFFANQPAGNTWTITSSDDTYYKLTAKNFAINAAVEGSPGKFATYTKVGPDGDTETIDKYNILDELTNMKTDTKVCKFRNSSASEFLQCITNDISLNAQRANTFCENFQNLEQSIDMMRTSISGVDEDEEAVNLTKYQNAFNLASRMIQTFTEIYDRLILSTGV